jgi:hypothetical protein
MSFLACRTLSSPAGEYVPERSYGKMADEPVSKAEKMAVGARDANGVLGPDNRMK